MLRSFWRRIANERGAWIGLWFGAEVASAAVLTSSTVRHAWEGATFGVVDRAPALHVYLGVG